MFRLRILSIGVVSFVMAGLLFLPSRYGVPASSILVSLAVVLLWWDRIGLEIGAIAIGLSAIVGTVMMRMPGNRQAMDMLNGLSDLQWMQNLALLAASLACSWAFIGFGALIVTPTPFPTHPPRA